MEIQYYEIDEPFSGEYTEEECPECGRERVMLCQDGKGIVKNVVGVLRTMSIKVNKEKLQKIYKEKK